MAYAFTIVAFVIGLVALVLPRNSFGGRNLTRVTNGELRVGDGDSPDGLTEGMLVQVHGVPIEVLVELINAGLAAVTVEQLARPPIEVARLTIADAGRKAIGRE